MTNDEAESFGFEKPKGVLVVAVHSDSPAAKAGLKPGDIIVKANDHLLQAVEDYQVALQGVQINESLNLTTFRKNKEEQIAFKLIAPPASEDPEIQMLATDGPFAGVKVANMSPAVAAEYNLVDIYRDGVIVIEVPQPLFGIGFSGLQPGDIIEEVNNKKMTSVKQLLGEMKANMRRMAVRRGQIILVLQAH
jgi:S1-C subfamily serine protease